MMLPDDVFQHVVVHFVLLIYLLLAFCLLLGPFPPDESSSVIWYFEPHLGQIKSGFKYWSLFTRCFEAKIMLGYCKLAIPSAAEPISFKLYKYWCCLDEKR